jgi:DNA modification methylase
MSEIKVEHGDCRDVIKAMTDASVHAVVTDPPYGIKFMAKAWDHGGTAFDPAFWAEVLRVLKPGGHLVAFGGTRTYHRLACAIEDGGFEIRDQIGWAFGSGFPKSHDVSKGIDNSLGLERQRDVVPEKRSPLHGDRPWMNDPEHRFQSKEAISDVARQWQGWGTALKPAWEPICLARKPLTGTVAANVLAHGTGALNIDGCRVSGDVPRTTRGNSFGRLNDDGWKESQTTFEPSSLGRWPANLIHDGSEEVLAAFAAAGDRAASHNQSVSESANSWFGKAHYDGHGFNDTGSAARFFYSAKADKGDRLGSKHPTVKPVDLMAYLCRLICPLGGTVLDPFAGSGATGMACMREGFDCILIEREAEYVADIRRRLQHVEGADTPLFDPFDAKADSMGSWELAISTLRERFVAEQQLKLFDAE